MLTGAVPATSPISDGLEITYFDRDELEDPDAVLEAIDRRLSATNDR